MSDMIKTLITRVLREKIQTEYTHLRYPASAYAKVVDVKEKDTFNSYTIKILDKNKNEDSGFPEIPQVFSDQIYHAGDIVVITLLYGDVTPFIIGKVF